MHQSIAGPPFTRNSFTDGPEPLANFAAVDGVVALINKTGCGMTKGQPLRVLAGFARHPNCSHVIAIGLECEVNQLGELLKEQRLVGRQRALNIQESGGTRKTVAAGFISRQ